MNAWCFLVRYDFTVINLLRRFSPNKSFNSVPEVMMTMF